MNPQLTYDIFWKMYFPEQELMTREQVMVRVGKQQRFETVEELRAYQEKVAPLYGAYEPARFQFATMEKLLPSLGQRVPVGTLISLGSGPGSYELWLVAQGFLNRCILVDVSETMLSRATEIATQLGLNNRVETICSEVATVTLPDEQADSCISINSLHWDQDWRTWIKKASKCTKPGGVLFFSASLLFPQSEMTADQFVGVAARSMTIREQGYVIPGTVTGGKVAQPTRFFVSGIKKTAKELRGKK